MRRDVYLMERIRLGDTQSGQSLSFDEQRYLKTVTAHLQHIFNVRQGSCMTLPEFGLPDFNDLVQLHHFDEALNEIKKSIRFNVEQYEPGLRVVNVNHVKKEDEPLSLSFEIVVRIQGERKPKKVTFETSKNEGETPKFKNNGWQIHVV